MLHFTLFAFSTFFSSCSKTTNEKKGLVIEPEKSFVMPTKCPGLAEPCLDPECSPYYSCNIIQNYGGVSVTYEKTSGMIKFNSISDANTVINKLLLDDSLWNSANDNQYGNYTVDQLDSIDLATNFDEFKKFRDFENLFAGFVSKRKSLETLENTWLSNSFSGTDPDNLDFTFEDAENTVFNNQNKFKIGTNIYELKVDGFYINGLFQGDGGSQFVTNATSPCFSGKRHNFYSELQVPNRKYKLKVAVHSIGIRSSAKGKVVSFKQKNSGGWKRSRAQIAVICGGNIYSTNCSFNFAFGIRKPSPSGFLKRKELEVAYRQWGSGGQIVYKTRPNETSATFQLPSGFSANILLF